MTKLYVSNIAHTGGFQDADAYALIVLESLDLQEVLDYRYI